MDNSGTEHLKEQFKYCKNCGHFLIKDAIYCGACGTKQINQEKPIIKSKTFLLSKKRVWISFLCAFLIVTIGILIAVFVTMSDSDGNADGKKRSRAIELLQNSTILNSTDFSGGYAWIWIESKEDKTRELLLVNSDMSVIYRTEYNANSFIADFGKNIGYYYNRDSGVYTIINSNGDILGSSDEDEFDCVLACGENNVFVYRDDSNYQMPRNVYSFMDASGEYTAAFWGLKKLPHNGAKYVGCDMYFIPDEDEQILINSKTGTITKYDVGEENSDNVYFVNDKATISTENKWNVQVNGESTDSSIAVIDTEGNVVHTSGYGDIDEYTMNLNENTIVVYPLDDSGERIVNIVEFSQDTWIETEKYNSCREFYASMFKDDMCMLVFVGVDKNRYFTVIDNEGNTIIAPTKCVSAAFNDGIVVYRERQVNGDILYNAMDIEGDMLFEGIDFDDADGPFKFYNGIGRVNETTFVDTTGKVIIGESDT